MEINIRDDSVEISGYVNAIERKSKPLWSRMGMFLERICKGAFKRALQRASDVRILLNHDKNRDLGGITDGNLELFEDSIGLFARALIKDPEVVKQARNGDLVGWSFGFYDRDVDQKVDEDGLPLRLVKDLDLEEVSILNRQTSPAYEGCLVSVRAEGEEKSMFFSEAFADEINIREITDDPGASPDHEDVPKQHENVDENKKIDYEPYHKLIADMKKED